jgi:signal peptidase I
MSELRGCLQDFGLVPLVRFVSEQGRSGSLKISQAGWVGEMVFDDGCVVGAAMGEERGQAALELITLALADGDFVYTDGSHPAVGHNIMTSTADLEVELENLISRPRRCAGTPLLRSVPHFSEHADEIRNRQVTLSRSDLQVLLDVDGRHTTEDIARGHDPVQTLRTLIRLNEVGVIELETNGSVETEVPRNHTQRALPGMVAETPPTVVAPPVRAVAELSGLLANVARVALMTVLFVLVLRSAVHSVHVEGQSMLPGLQDGQSLLINRLAYVFAAPQRGDVVVFQSPTPPDAELVKRITGLPGEELRIEQGMVFVDDRLLDESYVAPGAGGIDPYPAEGQSIRVPTDEYFVLGDNRGISLDSRLGWFVRTDQIVGRAWLRFWPLTELEILPQQVVAALPQPAATPVEEVSPAPVVTPSPLPLLIATTTKPTAEPAPTASQLPPLRTLLDGRVKDQSGWPTNQRGTASFDGNAYRLLSRQSARFVGVAAPIEGDLTDVFVSAAFHKIGGPPGGGYGIIARDEGPGPRDGVNQGGRFYVAAVGDRGEFGIWRREDDHWVDIVPWTPSAAVHPGGTTNELTLRAVGQRLTFLVNGIQATTVEDAALPGGQVGAFVGGDSNDVVLDRFTVQLPPTTVTP